MAMEKSLKKSIIALGGFFKNVTSASARSRRTPVGIIPGKVIR